MKKRAVSLLLALVLCLGLAVPAMAAPAEANLPDWYFLFAIFKNVDADVADRSGKATHQKYTMPQYEIEGIRDNAKEFEEYMSSLGIMRAHVDVVEIDAPVTELHHRDNNSSYLNAELAAPLLETKVDLDRYDHVTCFLDLKTWTGWAGITSSAFQNGAGISNINFYDGENYQKTVRALENRNVWGIQVYVHEFLHFMEYLNRKWGETFTLHRDGKTHYTNEDDWKTYYTDAILNQLDEFDVFPDGGTGVHPAAWQYPPHVLRTLTELAVPSGVTGIGTFAFAGNKTLTRVFIPSSVTSIGGAAFQACSSLASISLPVSITRVENYTFANCAKLTDIYYGGSEAQWKAVEIGSISNSAVSRATIHYNSLMADVKTDDWFGQSVAWALGEGITNGTGEGRFSPDDSCTQGQILTFLWRANGSPAPAGAVSNAEYYAAALQWAKEQKITSGAVNANAPCTRADAVTYLWRLAGSPGGGASFSDVPANASYAPAVAWALKNGVTKGTSETEFSPDMVCTRGQIVTFLHRALAE